jgi:hypothetical protein
MHWKDGSRADVYDRSVSEDTGLASGMNRATSVLPGVIGQALDFDGSSSCVTTPGQLFDNPSAFTIAGWVYPYGYNPSGFFGQNNSIEFGLPGDGRIKAWTPVASVDWNIDAGIYTLNHWHHVAVTAGPNGMRLYVDGEQVATNPVSVNGYGTDTPDTFSIGCNVWDGAGPSAVFNGKIDEVRAYNVALSADQIMALHRMGK